MPGINIHSNVSCVFCLLIFVLHCSTNFSTSLPVKHSHYLQQQQQNVLLTSKSRYSSNDRNNLIDLYECYDNRVTILLFSCCWIHLDRLRWIWASTRCSHFQLSLPKLCRSLTFQIVFTRTSAVPERFLNEFVILWKLAVAQSTVMSTGHIISAGLQETLIIRSYSGSNLYCCFFIKGYRDEPKRSSPSTF